MMRSGSRSSPTPRSAHLSASMIGLASSGVSLPSATSRRIVSTHQPSGSPPARRGCLLDVDLAALERLQDRELLVRADGRLLGGRGGVAAWGVPEGQAVTARTRRTVGSGDRDVAGHGVEEELRPAVADGVAAPIAGPLERWGTGTSDVGREAADLKRRARRPARAQVAADGVDPMALPVGELALELDVAGDRVDAQAAEMRRHHAEVAPDRFTSTRSGGRREWSRRPRRCFTLDDPPSRSRTGRLTPSGTACPRP